MQISKHLHSCLLVKDQNQTILIDPGNFTYAAHALDLNNLNQLDYILITHEHADHFHLPLIKDLLHKFPNVKIISNPSVVTILQTENITASSEGNEVIEMETLTHEKLWDKEPPQNTIFKIFRKLTHPGDSLHFTTSSDILALPLTAPWGSTTEAVKKALEINPKVIIPIHDFMWKDEIRVAMYERLTDFFKTRGIEFKGLKTGETVEV